MSNPNTDPAVALYFTVTLDFIDLGAWTTCRGLGVELKTDQRTEGGTGNLVNQMAGRLEYTPITLSRPVGADSAKVANWIRDNATQVQPKTAEIAAVDAQGNQIYSWSLQGVLPRRWTGPSFDSAQPGVAIEELELVHQGFL